MHDYTIDIGRNSIIRLADDYAKSWKDVLAADQRRVLSMEIAELISAVVLRAENSRTQTDATTCAGKISHRSKTDAMKEALT